MNSSALNNLTKIKDLKLVPGKTTSEYRISSAPLAPKNKRLVKTFTFSQRINKPELLRHQIELTKDIQSIHPITQCHIEAVKEGQKLLMIEEYIPNSNLTEYIDAKWKLDMNILARIALAIGQLHHLNIYHLNLKPENILFEAKDTFKFTDKKIPYLHSLIRKSKLTIPNSPYTPPEADGPYIDEGKWDVWSLGIIFMELALHRRIEYHQTTTKQALPILNRQIEDDGLRNVIKGMICQKNLRFTINEVIQCLKDRKSQQKGQIDNKDYVYVRLNLFSCDLLEKFSLPVKQQSFCLKVDSWMFSFTLIHLYSNQKVLWITANSHGNTKTFINIVYSSLPSHLQDYFGDLESFHTKLKTTNHQDFKMEKEGCLTIRAKKTPPAIAQPQSIVEYKQTKQTFVNSRTISTKQPHLLQKIEIQTKHNLSQIDHQPLPHSKQIIKSQHDDAELIFDSDSEVAILSDYTFFPKSHHTIAEITQRLEIMTKIQQPDIDLISMSYEQMGELFYDQSDFPLAKMAYKLARQGYICLHNKESIKEMNLLIELGNTYSKLGDFQKSIRCFRKSAYIAQQKNDDGVLVVAYKNWASVALHLKDDQTAEKYFLKCVEIYQKKPDSSQQLMGVYANLSNIYLKKQEYAKSNECIESYIRLNRNKKGDKTGVLNFNLGFGLLHINQFKEAFQALKHSLAEKYKQSMRNEIEKILIGVLRKKKQQIKQQLAIHKESIASLRKLLQSSAQKTLDSLLV